MRSEKNLSVSVTQSEKGNRARGYCNDYEDEDELMLNSAQHARSAASRLDDVIDRSALEHAREGLGGRDIEEPLIGLAVQKSTLEVRDGSLSPPRNSLCVSRWLRK